MNKRNIIILILIVVVALIAIFFATNNTNQTANTEDVKELIEYYSNGNGDSNEVAFVDSEILTITKDDQTKTYPLPQDEFFVSLAPYYNQTHPCATHYLTSCSSELENETFDITVIDEAGNVVFNDSITSKQNGFIDLWLPRDKNLSIKIVHNGNSIESTISTFKGDNTCITTPLKLSK